MAKEVVEDALSRQAAVVLIGPRQAGKTTLALDIGRERNAVYLDLEDPDDRAKLDHPTIYLEAMRDRLVILDEIHRMPDLFASLRGLIDKGRRSGLDTGRFLLLGSASLDLLRQSGETLAGRVAYVPLTPLHPLELEDNRATRDNLWLKGGFPKSFMSGTERESFTWRKDFIRTYLERDVPIFGPRIPATALERLWTMLAHRQGSMLNTADLGRSLEVSHTTIVRYIDLLCDLLLVRRLPPYHVNVGKRLVKSPKVYVRDSGLVHALLGISSLDDLSGHPISGFSWEGFVLEALLAVLPWRATAFFYRTAVGAEIDLLVELAPGKLWAIEIKRAASAKLEKSFSMACRDIQPERAFVVHSGDDRYPLGEQSEAIGIHELCREFLNIQDG